MTSDTRNFLIFGALLIAIVGYFVLRESKDDKISRLKNERLLICADFTLAPNDVTARLRCENATDALREALK